MLFLLSLKGPSETELQLATVVTCPIVYPLLAFVTKYAFAFVTQALFPSKETITFAPRDITL